MARSFWSISVDIGFGIQLRKIQAFFLVKSVKFPALIRSPPSFLYQKIRELARRVFLGTTEGGSLNLILDLVAAVSQLEQARVDQTAVVPGSYGPSPCPNVTALVHFGIAAFFFVAGSREPEFPRTLPYYLVDNCAWL